jgi:type IV pilus assembly protein PilY1
MPKLLNKFGSVVVLSVAGLVSSVPAHSQLSLAESPLFLTSGAEPNVMFILDDSGSMMFEVIPEELIFKPNGDTTDNSLARYVFPRAALVYGPAEKNSVAPQPDTIYGQVLRSKHNKLYYDPSVQYLPWVHPGATYVSPAVPSVPLGVNGRMPNALATCAWHNPLKTAVSTEAGCRNLTINMTRTFAVSTTPLNPAGQWITCTAASNASCALSSVNTGYYPATYWNITTATANPWTDTYAKVEIKSTTPTYTGDGRGAKRSDCTVDTKGTPSEADDTASCSYAQEIQNFANWYTYYRSRMLAARGGVGKAFSEQNDGMRVGFGAINQPSTSVDGVATTVIIDGVKKFSSSVKQKFIYDFYNRPVPNSGTPLHAALEAAGTYYSRTDNTGPWSKTPGIADATAHVACRVSNTILMTDGYWNGTIPVVGNPDNTAGATADKKTNNEPGATPATYNYSPSAPYSDLFSNTLADVAMKYWVKDLRTDLPNRIKVKVTAATDPDHANDSVDTAFWQHMTTYTIGFGVQGTLSPTPVVATAIKTNQAITWPNPTLGDKQKIDDLLHAAVNGHGDFFSAQDPTSFSEQLKKALDDIDGRTVNSAAAAASNSTSLNDSSVVFQAKFNSNDWSGVLEATTIETDGTYGANVWTSSIPVESARKIYTTNNTSGVIAGAEFKWANLSAAQQTALQGSSGLTTPAAGEARLNWVRGVDNIIVGDAEDLRDRKSKLLGDIVNSDPALAGINNSRFDRLPAVLGGGAIYTTWYNANKKSRREVLYVGANDGMMHAFNAHIPPLAPIVDPVPSGKALGEELFAYVPSAIYGKLRGLASETYGKNGGSFPHAYFVDGPIHVSDAYFNNVWHTILVGSLGAGGKGLYVLDVTDPESFGAGKVLFELTSARYPQLGNITGLPIIAPGRDGRWKIYVGNGYNSSISGAAVLGIIDIEDEITTKNDPSSTITKFITAGVIATGSGTENGLAQPALLPDSNGMIKAAYAGDLQGNLWKFDLSSTTATSWAVAYTGAPLFMARDSGGGKQPITSSPTLGVNSLTSPASTMVYFGTGRYLLSTDNAAGASVQTFYAIADKAVKITATDRSTLHIKTFTETATNRTIAGETTGSVGALVNAVNWVAKSGWYMDFNPGERIITKPLLLYDRVIFPTVIPSIDPCNSGGSGWLMELIGVGDRNLEYCVLCGELNGNVFLDQPVIGHLTSIQGTGKQPAKSATPSSSPSGCDGSGTIAVVGIDTSGKKLSKTGKRACDTFDRQSWRELQ